MHERGVSPFSPLHGAAILGNDTLTTPKNGLRRSMDNNNSRLRRSSRPTLVLAFGLVVSACQSMGPEQPPPAAAPPAVVAVAPLEAIVLPTLEYRDTIAEADLLTRLRSRFEWEIAADATVERERAWYARNQAYLDRVFTRADLYLFHIVGALEARDMPAELALLPIVESAFDPFAYSHGRAAGLWQIIPGTGKRLGLAQNWWFDGRRDVLDSTRAALDYLEQLHRQFDGDWLLAVAGYNSGEGNVARALKKAAAAGKPLDFWGIKNYLPAETRTYVPRLLAIAALVGNPAAFGVTLPELRNEPRFAVVTTGSQIDMALAARLAGIETDALYALNPGVNRWATDPEGPHRLLLPIAQAGAFATSLAALGERERVEWTRHRVSGGDTIGGIAERYHTTPAVLREVNGLRGNTIRAGDYLMIPHATQSLASYTQSADARATRQQSATRSGERRAHVVKNGESLWSISRAYDVDLRSLASWNAMAPGDVLSVGRELVVWASAPAATAATATAATPVAAIATTAQASLVSSGAAASFAATPRIREITYVVRRGDSLSSIARRFKVSVDKLVEWNTGAAGKYLQPGQRLKMVVDITEQSG
jgi:membrane-bound lytic murein transglycosylase D